MPSTPYRKKLIEVDLPLDAINEATVKDRKAPGRKGQPSAIHQWWARRPITACRAVAWASVVDDPSSCPDEFPTLAQQSFERRRLHDLLIRLIKWENATDPNVINEACIEIAKSIARDNRDPIPKNHAAVKRYIGANGPSIYDPFCGGGSIPLEVQRLGLTAKASDINPVAVLITKALVEFPPKFSGMPPTEQDPHQFGEADQAEVGSTSARWDGASGMAEDVRRYGRWIKDQAYRRLRDFYPPCRSEDGSNLNVMTWLWTRSVSCSNPACQIDLPLLRTFQISRRKGSERWVKPIYHSDLPRVQFVVQDHPDGVPKSSTTRRTGVSCFVCGTVSTLDYIRSLGSADGIESRLLAIVAEVERDRVFLNPTSEHEEIALASKPAWRPSGDLPRKALSIRPQIYGFNSWYQLFTPRQLSLITTLCDLVKEVRGLVYDQSGGDEAYANAIQLYLALAVGKIANAGNTFTVWDSNGHAVKNMFARQGIGMTWDFPEANPFAETGKNITSQIDSLAQTIELLPTESPHGSVWQQDAAASPANRNVTMFLTDPPYYDNIHYSDSSDFFYVWLRSMLRDIQPELFGGILTPKKEEIVANRFRDEDPDRVFENRLSIAIANLRKQCDGLSALFYAYKQNDTAGDKRASTGWDTMLTALTDAGFQIVATWPMQTELTTALKKSTNSLATSVVIVVRPRPDNAPVVTRQEFLEELEIGLPVALDRLTRGGHITPADLPQAAIGPGMEIYSKHRRVETISGDPVTVRDALQHINRVISSYFDREEGELDITSRFCVDWMKTHGYSEAAYGDAENIARAKNISVSDIANIHNLIVAEHGDVQLYPISRYHPDREYPMTDMTAWEGCMRMAYHLDTGNEDGNGVAGCGEVGRRMSGNLDSVERLARILYNHYDNLDRPRDAYIYNQLVTEWQNILNEVQSPPEPTLV